MAETGRCDCSQMTISTRVCGGACWPWVRTAILLRCSSSPRLMPPPFLNPRRFCVCRIAESTTDQRAAAFRRRRSVMQAANLNKECSDGFDLPLNAAGSKLVGVSARWRSGATRPFERRRRRIHRFWFRLREQPNRFSSKHRFRTLRTLMANHPEVRPLRGNQGSKTPNST